MDTKKQIQTVYVDLMERGKHIGQIPYHFCPLWGVNLQEVRKYVLEKRPSLRNRAFSIKLSDKRIFH